MRTLFILLFSCLSCLAQFGVEQPMFANQNARFTPRDILGLAYWWNYSDLPIGQDVTNWVDRIQGSVWTNWTAAKPLNTTNGVRFTGTQALTNTGGAVGGTSPITTVLITRWTSPGDDFDDFISYYNPPSLRYTFSLLSASAATTYSAGSKFTSRITTSFADFKAPNIFVNATIQLSMGVQGPGNNDTWRITTNGIISRELSGINWGTPKYHMMGIAESDYLSSDIRELLIYTNLLTENNLSNLYTLYCKTTYVDTDNNYYPGNGTTNDVLIAYDIDALALSSGTIISNVPDAGPYGYNITNAVVANRPYWTNNAGVINNKGFAYFDGSNDALTNNFPTYYAQPLHAFVVANGVGIVGVSSCMFSGATASGTNWIAFYEYNNEGFVNACAGTCIQTTFADAWRIWEIKYNGDWGEIRTNNVIGTIGYIGQNGITGFHLGNNIALNGPFNGGIAAFLMFTNILSNTSADNLVKELGTKYGITTYTRN